MNGQVTVPASTAMKAVKPVNGEVNGFHTNGHEDIEAPGMRRVVSAGAFGKMGMRITFQVRCRRKQPPSPALNSNT